MRTNILNAIRCPKCYGTIEADVKEEIEDRIITGEIICKSCNIKYPVIDEIPYLAIIDKSWYPKIQEIIARRDIYKAWLTASSFAPISTVTDKREILHEQQNRASGEIKKNLFEDTLTLFSDRRGLKICDVGASLCETSACLAGMGHEVVAVDIEYDDLKKAKALVGDFYFERIMGDGERLPFKNNYFDVTFCRSTLHHFNALNRVIGEMVRITRRGGRFMAVSEPIRTIFDDEFDYLKEVIDYQNGLNEHIPTFWDYYKVMRKNKLKNIRVMFRNVALGYRKLSKISGAVILSSLRKKKEISGIELLKLLFVGAGVNMIADKNYESFDSPRPIKDKDILVDVTVILDFTNNENTLRNILKRNGWNMRKGQKLKT